jgi:hypothetical protein
VRAAFALLALAGTAHAAPVTGDIDGTSVTLALDREVVAPGDRVTATVAAAKPIAVYATLLRWRYASEDHGFFRVIATRKLAVSTTATAGFTVGDRGGARGVNAHYVVVLDPTPSRVGSDYRIGVESELVTASVQTWSGDTMPVALVATSAIATVRVTNPARKRVTIRVELGTELVFDSTRNEGAIDDPVRDDELGPGETRTFAFVLHHPGRLVALVKTGDQLRAVATTTAP